MAELLACGEIADRDGCHSNILELGLFSFQPPSIFEAVEVAELGEQEKQLFCPRGEDILERSVADALALDGLEGLVDAHGAV